MKTICEMLLTRYFKYSKEHVALIGIMQPNLDAILMECKADLYVDNEKLYSINILGEDYDFVTLDEATNVLQRLVITSDDIYDELKLINNAEIIREIKLVFYKN